MLFFLNNDHSFIIIYILLRTNLHNYLEKSYNKIIKQKAILHLACYKTSTAVAEMIVALVILNKINK